MFSEDLWTEYTKNPSELSHQGLPFPTRPPAGESGDRHISSSGSCRPPALNGKRAASSGRRSFLAIVLLWLVPLSTSLGLDECGNWWVVKDGLKRKPSPELPFGRVDSPSYLTFLLLWARERWGGDSDVHYAHPVCAGLPSSRCSFSTRLGPPACWGPLAAMFSCLAYVCLTDVVYVASTVRPYALGLMFVIAAMLAPGHVAGYRGACDMQRRTQFFSALSLYASYFLRCRFHCSRRFIAGIRIVGRDFPAIPWLRRGG